MRIMIVIRLCADDKAFAYEVFYKPNLWERLIGKEPEMIACEDKWWSCRDVEYYEREGWRYAGGNCLYSIRVSLKGFGMDNPKDLLGLLCYLQERFGRFEVRVDL